MIGMNWIRDTFGRLFERQPAPVSIAPPAPAPKRARKPAPARVAAPPPPPAPSKRGRPVSDSLSRTLEKLQSSPDIAPPELAIFLGVSKDYARTLLRRARTKAEEDRITAAKVTQPVRTATPPAGSRKKKTAASRKPVKPEPVRETIVSFPGQSLNLNRRTQVLRRIESGEQPQAVAAAVGIPPGEVDFIVKVDRMLKAAF